MMEKHLLGASAPSLLPARAGLGTASIDSDSGSMETGSGEARGGCAEPTAKRFASSRPGGIPLWDPLSGSHQRPQLLPSPCVPALPWGAVCRT